MRDLGLFYPVLPYPIYDALCVGPEYVSLAVCQEPRRHPGNGQFELSMVEPTPIAITDFF